MRSVFKISEGLGIGGKKNHLWWEIFKKLVWDPVDSDTDGNLDFEDQKVKKIVWKFKLSFKSLNCRG